MKLADIVRKNHNAAGDMYHHAVKLKRRFPAGEAIILTDPYWAMYYAIDVIKGRWPAGEKIIATNKVWDAKYKEFLKTLK